MRRSAAILSSALVGVGVIAAGWLVAWRTSPERPPVAVPAPSPDATPPARVAEAPASAPTAAPERPGVHRTELPLRLIATVVREDAELSLATLEDQEHPGRQVLAEGQLLAGRPQVKLLGIERAQVFLDNDGVVELLEIDRSDQPFYMARSAADLPPEVRERRQALARRIRELTESGLSGDRVREGLLAEGSVEPIYDDEGELTGIRLDDLRAGGLYERFGLREGDVVTSVNGVDLADPGAAAALVYQVAGSEEIQVEVDRDDGTQEVVTIPGDEVRSALDELGSLPEGALPEGVDLDPDAMNLQGSDLSGILPSSAETSEESTP